MQRTRRLNAILFADIAGYTAIMERDEALAQRSLQKFRVELEALVPSFQGRIIHFMGDGCLCVFDSNVQALECALGLQRRFRTPPGVPVRIGLHSGDVYFENDSVFGDSVNIASRIESIALPGSVLFSERIFNDIRNHALLDAQRIGEVSFKNVSRPIRIYGLQNDEMPLPERHQLQGKIDRKTGKRSKSWMAYTALGILVLIAAVVALQSQWPLWPAPSSADVPALTVAVLGFDNKTGDAEYDVLSEISSDRFINGISQLDIARVISGKTIRDYEKIMVASAAPTDQLASLRENFGVNRVVEGQIYRMGGDLLMECTITDPAAEDILAATPSVRFSEQDPMKGIEEMRQHILSALIVDEDRHRNLLLETRPPHYEAYKALLAAKEAESDEDMLVLLNKAIELDSSYFEPQVLAISCYYNLGQFATADSLTRVVDRQFMDADPRQKNLLNFYRALMAGENNRVYYHLNEELRLAPFDMMTNNTTMVLATQFVNDIQKAFEIYDIIDEDRLDFSNCRRCRTRLFIKIYMDIEAGDIKNALRLGKIMADNGDKARAERLRLRAWVRSGNWQELDQYIKDEQLTGGTDAGSLALYTAKECALAGRKKPFDRYREAALQSIGAMTTNFRKAEITLMSEDYEKAVALFEKEVEIHPADIQNRCMLAVAHLLNGNPAMGHSLLQQADQMRRPYQYGEVDYYLATAYGQTGQQAKALEHLRSAIAQGARIGFYDFHNDYWLLPLREDPRFEEILRYWREDSAVKG